MQILPYRLLVKLYHEWARKAHEKYGIPISLILAVIRQESGGNPLAESFTPKGEYTDDDKDGCFGLMQVDPRWALQDYIQAKGYIDKDLLLRGDICVDVGTWYLARLKSIFKENMFDALRAYNVGIGTVQKGKTINGSDGTKYAQSVLEHEKQILKVMESA